ALLDNGRRVLALCDDRPVPQVILWDAEKGMELRRPCAKVGDIIQTMAVSRDERQVLLGGARGSLVLWDLETDQPIRRFETPARSQVMSVALSPGGRYALTGQSLVKGDNGKVVPEDCSVRLWDTATGKVLKTFEGHQSVVTHVTVSADGSRGLSASFDQTCR